jgi:hypothetical protein
MVLMKPCLGYFLLPLNGQISVALSFSCPRTSRHFTLRVSVFTPLPLPSCTRPICFHACFHAGKLPRTQFFPMICHPSMSHSHAGHIYKSLPRSILLYNIELSTSSIFCLCSMLVPFAVSCPSHHVYSSTNISYHQSISLLPINTRRLPPFNIALNMSDGNLIFGYTRRSSRSHNIRKTHLHMIGFETVATPEAYSQAF